MERPTTRRKAYGSLDESREQSRRQGPTREMRLAQAVQQNAEIAAAEGRLLLQLVFFNKPALRA